jgi:ABC-type bacteriocin/lantibiotic exporter with double-glycine peptidase domain
VGHNCPMGADVTLDVPFVAQRDDISCGPACVRAVLRYWKVRAPVPVADIMDGIHAYHLDVAFRAAGLRVMSGEMDVDRLRLLTRSGWPVVCLVRADTDGHWLVVRSVQRGRVYWMCPTDGLGSEPVGSFVARWYDTDRHGSEFRRWAVCAWKE